MLISLAERKDLHQWTRGESNRPLRSTGRFVCCNQSSYRTKESTSRGKTKSETHWRMHEKVIHQRRCL